MKRCILSKQYGVYCAKFSFATKAFIYQNNSAFTSVVKYYFVKYFTSCSPYCKGLEELENGYIYARIIQKIMFSEALEPSWKTPNYLPKKKQ